MLEGVTACCGVGDGRRVIASGAVNTGKRSEKGVVLLSKNGDGTYQDNGSNGQQLIDNDAKVAMPASTLSVSTTAEPL